MTHHYDSSLFAFGMCNKTVEAIAKKSKRRSNGGGGGGGASGGGGGSGGDGIVYANQSAMQENSTPGKSGVAYAASSGSPNPQQAASTAPVYAEYAPGTSLHGAAGAPEYAVPEQASRSPSQASVGYEYAESAAGGAGGGGGVYDQWNSDYVEPAELGIGVGRSTCTPAYQRG